MASARPHSKCHWPCCKTGWMRYLRYSHGQSHRAGCHTLCLCLRLISEAISWNTVGVAKRALGVLFFFPVRSCLLVTPAGHKHRPKRGLEGS